MSEYIGLALVATDDGYHRLCKFPPFKLAVTRGVKVVLMIFSRKSRDFSHGMDRPYQVL